MDNTENTDQQRANAVNPGQRLRELAQIVRQDPTARESIAEGFELIAEAMEPCEDCGRKKDQSKAIQELNDSYMASIASAGGTA